MQPTLNFAFPVDTSAHDAIAAVAAHYGVIVAIGGEAPIAPPNVQAVINASASALTAQSQQQAPASPQATVATPQVGSTAPQLDKDGLPWDGRIHSTPAALTDKGYWRAKRGVGNDKAMVAAVEAELRAIVGKTPPAAVPVDTLEQPGTVDASTYAHNKAIEICGVPPMTMDLLNALLSGQPASVSPEQADYFVGYSAARNKYYQEARAGNIAAQQAVSHARVPSTQELQALAASQNVAAPVAPTPPAPPAPPAPAAPTPPAPPAPPVVTPEQAGTSFEMMMRWLAANKVAGRITDAQIVNICQVGGLVDGAGVGSIALAANASAEWYPYIVHQAQQVGAV